MSKTILMFGSTGSTGSEALKLALEGGHKVKAFVRTPSKIPEDLKGENLTVVEGDITDAAAVKAAIEGVDIVMAFVGHPFKKVPEDKEAFSKFFVVLLEGCAEHGVKRLTYQAGGFSPLPGEKLPVFTRVLRAVMAKPMGISYGVEDNDRILQLVTEKGGDLDWTITRPGALSGGPSKKEAKTVAKMPNGPMKFVDLAAYTLKIAVEGEEIGKCPYVGY